MSDTLLPPVRFRAPTKVHFRSTSGSNIAAIYADCIAPHSEGTNFYLGEVCTAVLSDRYLVLGPRKVGRQILSSLTPYSYDREAVVEQVTAADNKRKVPACQNDGLELALP